MRRTVCLLALTLLLTPAAWASDDVPGDVIKEAGREFPAKVNFTYDGTDYALTATGKATRKKVVVKVYGMVHYMDATGFESKEAARDAALSGEHAMQITMKFCRDIDALKIQNAYREGFEKNATETEMEDIENLVSQFVDYFTADVKKDDEYVLRSIPGGTILTVINGEEQPPIQNVSFASLLWRIWLDKGSVVNPDDLVKFAVAGKD